MVISSSSSSCMQRKGSCTTAHLAAGCSINNNITIQRSVPSYRPSLRLQASRLAVSPLGRSQQQQQQQQSAGGAAAHQPSATDKLTPRTRYVLDYSPLLLVSLLWGSYTPVLRYLYSIDPLLTPQVLTAHRTVISAVALLAASAASIGYSKYLQKQQHKQEVLQRQQQQLEQQQHWQYRLLAVMPEWLQHFGSNPDSDNSSRGRQDGVTSSSGDDNSSTDVAATASAAAVLAAGLELGVWNFLGTSSQVGRQEPQYTCRCCDLPCQ